MSLKAGLFAHLTADVAIAAAVGTKVYPTIAPQDVVWPFVVYDVTRDEEFQFHSGPSGLHNATVQVRVQTTSQPDAESIGRLVYDALRATDGGWGDVTVARVAAQPPEVVFVPGTDRLDTFQASIDVEVQYYSE